MTNRLLYTPKHNLGRYNKAFENTVGKIWLKGYEFESDHCHASFSSKSDLQDRIGFCLTHCFDDVFVWNWKAVALKK